MLSKINLIIKNYLKLFIYSVQRPHHKRKIKNVWKYGAAKEGINESEFALQSIYKNCLEKGYITTKQLVEMM